MGDDLFSLDTVRDFMISRGGKVTNHQLVTHFKTYLNDPNRKKVNREKFKEYVNTLASVKLDESGEKVLVLKRKFRDVEGAAGAELPSAPASAPRREPPKAKLRDSPFLTSPPTGDLDDSPAVSKRADEEEEEEVPEPEDGASAAVVEEPDTADTGSDDIGAEMAEEQEKEVDQFTDNSAAAASRLRSVSGMEHEEPAGAEVLDLKRTDTEESQAASMTSSTSSINNVMATPAAARPNSAATDEPPEAPMSVKDRARFINKIQSETDLHSASLKNRQAAESGEKKEEDSQSMSSVAFNLDPTEREWIIVAASADYHPIAKLLLKNQHLVRRRDFTTGFSALHWAAKHGKPEVVKLLCGSPGVQVNARSYGGYTPLHLAAMHGHEDIIELLVQTYSADPNIRDHSGKKPKQYLRNSASTRAQQHLQTRTRGSTAGSHAPFRRVGSYSAKIQKTGFFGITSGSAIRNSWTSAGSGEGGSDKEQSKSPSPSASPQRSPRVVRKGSLPSGRDRDLMPPPAAPTRRRKSKKSQKEGSLSDTESGPEVVHRVESDPGLSTLI